MSHDHIGDGDTSLHHQTLVNLNTFPLPLAFMYMYHVTHMSAYSVTRIAFYLNQNLQCASSFSRGQFGTSSNLGARAALNILSIRCEDFSCKTPQIETLQVYTQLHLCRIFNDQDKHGVDLSEISIYGYAILTSKDIHI